MRDIFGVDQLAKLVRYVEGCIAGFRTAKFIDLDYDDDSKTYRVRKISDIDADRVIAYLKQRAKTDYFKERLVTIDDYLSKQESD